ncbi:MAG: hypothetical protein BWX45_00354 [Deltaproteobacteria bacterium ADurb.Bin002]|nr:MAG: hypothetical protein BWX45_00354 [Deltaproteobacteria bacterium ADurb.Bin002]
MQNFPVHGNGDRLGSLNRPLQGVFADFPAFYGDNAQRVLSFDVAAGNPDIGGVDAAAGHVLGVLHGLLDRLDGAVDVDHTPLAQFLGGRDPHADDVNAGWFYLADNRNGFGRSNINSHQNVAFLSHNLTLPRHCLYSVLRSFLLLLGLSRLVLSLNGHLGNVGQVHEQTAVLHPPLFQVRQNNIKFLHLACKVVTPQL